MTLSELQAEAKARWYPSPCPDDVRFLYQLANDALSQGRSARARHLARIAECFNHQFDYEVDVVVEMAELTQELTQNPEPTALDS